VDRVLRDQRSTRMPRVRPPIETVGAGTVEGAVARRT
jgi:hypothetical protein